MRADAAGGRPYAGRPGDLRAPQDHHSDEWDEALLNLGYTWCRPCLEWHRPPECWIDESGRSALDAALEQGEGAGRVDTGNRSPAPAYGHGLGVAPAPLPPASPDSFRS